MGGKGGGGGGGNWQDVYATDPKTGGVLMDASGNMVSKAAYAQQQSDEAAALAAANKPPPAPAPEAPAPAPEAPAPEPEAPKPVDPLGPAVGSGGFIDQPDGAKSPFGAGSMTDTGDVLGGSVLNPPNYWTGKGTTKKSGSQTNTQS